MIVTVEAPSRLKLSPSFRREVPRIVKKVFQSENEKWHGEVAVVFVDRKKIRQLNQQFLSTKGDTDVIAFPYEDQSGDVYICVPVAKENAVRFGEPLARELKRLVIHGSLHLLGYADYPKKKRDEMWKVQEALVQRI